MKTTTTEVDERGSGRLLVAEPQGTFSASGGQPQTHERHTAEVVGNCEYCTLASLNLSCQLGLFEVLNRLGRWSAYGQTLLSGENSGSDQLIVVELIKRRTGQEVLTEFGL